MLNFEVEGSGPSLLLLHSSVCDLRMWEPQIQWLSRSFQTLGIDFAGYGLSPLEGDKGQDVADVFEVMDEVGMNSAIFMGSSFGGRVAQECVMVDPHRVDELILICAATSGVEPTEDLLEFVNREDELTKTGRIEDATLLNVNTWLGPLASNSVREYVSLMQRNAFSIQLAKPEHSRERVDIELSKVLCPTTILIGKHDLPFFQNTGRHLHHNIRQSRLVEIEWAGHLPNLEDPQGFLKLLESIL